MGDQPELLERTLECSGQIVLECGCGERLVLLGLEEDWRSKDRTAFKCGYGRDLTLTDCLDAAALAIKRLLRGGESAGSA